MPHALLRAHSPLCHPHTHLQTHTHTHARQMAQMGHGKKWKTKPKWQTNWSQQFYVLLQFLPFTPLQYPSALIPISILFYGYLAAPTSFPQFLQLPHFAMGWESVDLRIPIHIQPFSMQRQRQRHQKEKLLAPSRRNRLNRRFFATASGGWKGGRGYWGWIGERGLELSWRCVCRLQALLPHHCPSTCAYVINGVWVLRLTCKGRVVKAKWKWLRALPYEGVTPIYNIFLSFAKKPIWSYI